MTSNDLTTFKRAITDVAKAFGIPMKGDRIESYWTALRDLSLPAFSQACIAAIRSAGTQECKYFPLPGVLRQLAAGHERSHAHPNECPTCDGTGWVTAQPDMDLVGRLYGKDATAASAQLTVTRCHCRSAAR